MTELEILTASLSNAQQNTVVDILRNADIARCSKNTTVQHELKIIKRRVRGGKIKRVLSLLSKHENTLAGVDFLFKTGLKHV
jgi:hypothetical protein